MCVGKVLSRDLTQQLNNAIQFLVHCRPLSISMGNAIKYVKLQASHLLSFAYQSHSVTWPQSTSMGSCVKYAKLQASPLLLFPDQSHSVSRLTGECYISCTPTGYVAAKAMCTVKPFSSCWLLLDACIFSLCHGLWCQHGFTRVYA